MRFELLRRVPPWRRLDVYPFALVYAALHYSAWSAQLSDDRSAASERETRTCLILLPCVLLVHFLTFLSSQWSVRCQCLLGYERAKHVAMARVVLATPTTTGGGAAALVPLLRSAVLGAACTFQQKVFTCSEHGEFAPLDFPTALPLCEYQRARGLADTTAARQKWGSNEFELPDPSFGELFKEHAFAPFFVFQVLCVLLWSLDELWYYSMFTLVMLVVFESTVCKQRQRSLEFLRNMRRPPRPIYVFRAGAWELIMSDGLLPGDVCSLARVAPSIARGRAAIRPRVQGSESGGEGSVPCDMLLLRGSAVVNEAMLTGESVPQRKDSLDALAASADALSKPLQLGDGGGGGQSAHRRHVVFGGTQVLQHDGSESTSEPHQVPRPPDQGCVAYVLRTGFETGQGQLMRTILFATERVTANSAETGCFIAILLVFAIIASSYVLHIGLQDDTRNRYKLVLHCIMIVTSVVPPELPMELSLAVTNSLTALMRLMVYCTEPFRIPFAGKVDVCCFDKTGTLTSDELVLCGIVAPLGGGEPAATSQSSAVTSVAEPDAVGLDVLYIIAGCHSLLQLDGKTLGDPLELASMTGIGWMPYGPDIVIPRRQVSGRSAASAPEPLRILHRYAFSSDLRRMSAIVSVGFNATPKADAQLRIVVKGAPEALESLFVNVPAHYVSTYRHHMACGHRVLALGHRLLPPHVDIGTVRKWERSAVECDLIFAGFLILNCPLKSDTKYVISELQQSSHRCVMITGDGPLTAAHVAREVGMITQLPSRTMVLLPDSAGELAWFPLSGNLSDLSVEVAGSGAPADGRVNFDESRIADLASEYALCIMGETISTLVGTSADDGTRSTMTSNAARVLQCLCQNVIVFARVAPHQKELILASLNTSGAVTLMCGDGTNDVGALKQAHVGVSIINSPELERRLDTQNGSTSKLVSSYSAQENANGDTSRSMARALAELEEQELDPTLVQLGDASIASPFTSRRVSIDCVLSIIRQGRCTLVTTLQVRHFLRAGLVAAIFCTSHSLNIDAGVQNPCVELPRHCLHAVISLSARR